MIERIYSAMTDNDSEITLSNFLKTNSPLFTVLGVFGAVSVYLLQFPWSGASRGIQMIGFTSSLMLFFLTAAAIQLELTRSIDRNLSDFLIQPEKKNLFFMLFIVPFYILLGTVGWMIYTNLEYSIFIIQFVSILFGGSLVVLVFRLWDVLNLPYVPDEDDSQLGVTLLWSSRGMIFISSITFLTGWICLIILTNMSGYHPLSIVDLDPISPLIAILGGIGVGLVGISLLYLFLALCLLSYCLSVIFFVRSGALDIILDTFVSDDD